MPRARRNKKTNEIIKDLEYVKDYPEPSSFRSRLEAAVIKFEKAIDETIEQLKGQREPITYKVVDKPALLKEI